MKKKGKILKVKKGYNPNCSSGMWALVFIFICPLVGGITGIASIIASIIMVRTHKQNLPGMENKKLSDSNELEESTV